MESDHKYWLTDHLDVRVFAADMVTIGDEWRYRNYPLGHWRLYRNDRDGAKLHFAREVFALQKDRTYIIPAGLRFRTSCEGEVEHLFVHFNVTGLPDLALRTMFQHPRVLEPSPVLDVLLNQLKDELRSPPTENTRELLSRRNSDIAMQWRLKAAVYEALAHCVRGLTAQQTESCWQFAREVRPLVAALRYIEENLAENLNNTDLAELCGFSCDHFIRVFSATMDQTPAAYIRERRLAEASRLLMFSDENLDTIAQHTGFYDRAHFSRTFKASYGQAPTPYRAQNRSANPDEEAAA